MYKGLRPSTRFPDCEVLLMSNCEYGFTYDTLAYILIMAAEILLALPTLQ